MLIVVLCLLRDYDVLAFTMFFSVGNIGPTFCRHLMQDCQILLRRFGLELSRASRCLNGP